MMMRGNILWSGRSFHMMNAIGSLSQIFLHFSQKSKDSIDCGLDPANFLPVNKKTVLRMMLNWRNSRKNFNIMNKALSFFQVVCYCNLFILLEILCFMFIFFRFWILGDLDYLISFLRYWRYITSISAWRLELLTILLVQADSCYTCWWNGTWYVVSGSLSFSLSIYSHSYY